MNLQPGHREVHLPPRLAARPVDPQRGLPIPYVNEHDDGNVNFAVINGGRVLDCVRRRLCGCAGNRTSTGSPSSADPAGSTSACTPIRRDTSTACTLHSTIAGTWPSNATVAAG